MKPFEDLYPLLLIELPGCPLPLLDLHIREIAREFCTATSVWRSEFDSLNLVANQLAYDISAPESDSELVRLTKLTVGEDLMWEDQEFRYPTDRRRLDRLVVRPRYNRDEPPFTLSPNLDQITLIKDLTPGVSLVGGLKIEGIMRPTRASTSVPDILLDQFSEAMRTGVLHRLMVMGNQPWTNVPLGKEYRAQWFQHRGFAAYEGQVGNTRRHLRVKKWG